MYIMYVDESGDPGKLHPHSSQHYILSGLIISIDDWQQYMNKLKELRLAFKKQYGLNIRTEIHAAELIRIGKIEEYRGIHKSDRIRILRDISNAVPIIFSNAKIINICFDKAQTPTREEYQTLAWSRLLQRYDNYLRRSVKAKGIIISDDSNDKLLRGLIRKMRVYNPTTSYYSAPGYYDIPISNIVEDVFSRSSEQSYLIQMVDVVAHLLYRKEFPKGSLKKHGVDRFFDNLEPILLKAASKTDPLGIVRK